VVPVGAATSASVLAGATTATIAIPAATAGSGTLTIVGSSTEPTSSSNIGSVNTISIPGTAIAFVSLTTNAGASATYAAFPTLSFALPAGTSTANESFALALYDSSADFSLETVAMPGTITAPTTPGGAPTVAFASSSFTFFTPTTVGAPPLLPITLNAGSTLGFALYESTVSPSPSPSPT
jgi:hypothetical protein